jgi:Spy/CpxP family protein refolding chaperone
MGLRAAARLAPRSSATAATGTPSHPVEGDEPNHKKGGRNRRDVEGQDLDDQRRADIGAKHDRERRDQINMARRERRSH